ncbi:YtxH domain-containing protein [Rufibacter latericius]|uniref:YtxH domain-containing protein n=1 Tax=Rufibacter latericius TaxID=2487040 RepID=A0A3M9N259_9BACT|nr:YtxH domain-containing protein [Rufibacter latericius]RNI31118.1 YtxH domain-containing protein [Rufibacter latericius]
MKDDNGKIILAMLAGASAGLVAGILMAPEAGETTRGNLKKSASKLGSGIGSTVKGLGSSAGSLLGRKSGSGDPDVVNTGSNSTPTSHLDNNPTGGNVDLMAGDNPRDNATGTAPSDMGAGVGGGAYGADAGTLGSDTDANATGTSAGITSGATTKPKRASRAKGAAKGGSTGTGADASV